MKKHGTKTGAESPAAPATAIAWYTRDTERGESAQAVLPLFYHSRGKDQGAFLTVLAGARHAGPQPDDATQHR